MTRPGPIASTEEQDLKVLTHLRRDSGVGFNELWRRIKTDGHGVSYSTLSNTLKRLRTHDYVEFVTVGARKKIPQHMYYKTERGRDYELHLNDKLRLSLAEPKKIVKARRGEIRYNQVIFGEVPYTCEIELSAPNLTREKEEAITAFAGTVGDTVTANIAETLNQAYSGFISLLGSGKREEAFDHLKRALGFKLKLTIAFDGSRVAVDEAWQQPLKDQNALSTVANSINTPSYMELLSCWIFSLLSIIFPNEKHPYDLTEVEGWAQLVTERSNKIRSEKRLPLLKLAQVRQYLKEQIDEGKISITPVHLDTGIMQFHDEIPRSDPEESYSFILGLTSTLKTMIEGLH
ncbi:hypothetical protein KEJ39_00070 [Candidatus Bathyarchaeota archaeon]|nr:hypothetical protein [Candidatus Bathyarchaeota archaeon]